MPDQNNKGGNHEFCGQCTVCKIILSHQNKQLNNCTCGNPPRGAHWESCASLCTKSNYEGDGEKHKGVCDPVCDGKTGCYEGEEKCKNCDRENHGDFACREYVKKCCISDSLPPQENDWKEKFYTEFKSLSYEYPNTYEQILSFIKSLLALREHEAYERGHEDTIKHLKIYGFGESEMTEKIKLARVSRDQKWKRAISDRIKHKFNGYGGKLGFTQSDLLDLMSLSPEEEK